MREVRRHTYQVLTKRHERMEDLLSGPLSWMGELPNVWFGVSVENRRQGLPRLEALRRTPAAVRFASVEPLLEDLGDFDLTGIDWVIVGGESGPGARPMEEAWVVNVLRQCRRDGVPFFFKQWGGVRKRPERSRASGADVRRVPGELRAAPGVDPSGVYAGHWGSPP